MAMNKKERQVLEDAQIDRDMLMAFHWTDAPAPLAVEDAQNMPKVWMQWGDNYRLFNGSDISRHRLLGRERFHATESACLQSVRAEIERECALKLLTIDRRLASLAGKGEG